MSRTTVPAVRENKPEDARAAFARAVERGSRSYYVCFHHAQLLWNPNLDRQTLGRMEESLERAIRLNPDSADAHAFLADVKTDLDKTDAALSLSRRAVELEPLGAGPRLVAARVLDRLHKTEEARKVTEIGLALAKTDAERQRGQSFLDYLKTSASQATFVDDFNKSALACNGGDPVACGKLAPLLEKKCGEGDGASCAFVAWLHESGKGVAADPFAAFTFYQMACDRGEIRGCTRQAALQARGVGVPKDEPKARAKLEPLCDGHCATAATPKPARNWP